MLGAVRMNQQRYVEAELLFRASATDILNRTPFMAWGNLGWALLEQGKGDEALEALDTAVRLQPRFCLGHFHRGRVFFEKEDFANAENAFTHALEADERCTQYYQAAWRFRGETRARLGHREDALNDFTKCVELGETTDDGRVCQRFLEN